MFGRPTQDTESSSGDHTDALPKAHGFQEYWGWQDETSKPTAEKSQEELAKEAQNPFADVYSFPLQDNFGLNYGPNKEVFQRMSSSTAEVRAKTR